MLLLPTFPVNYISNLEELVIASYTKIDEWRHSLEYYRSFYLNAKLYTDPVPRLLLKFCYRQPISVTIPPDGNEKYEISYDFHLGSWIDCYKTRHEICAVHRITDKKLIYPMNKQDKSI